MLLFAADKEPVHTNDALALLVHMEIDLILNYTHRSVTYGKSKRTDRADGKSNSRSKSVEFPHKNN